MLANLLSPVASLNSFLLSTPVHPTLFPYPLLSTLHAIRISLAYRSLSKKAWDEAGQDVKSSGKPTWAYDIVGFLIMCWGGSLLNNLIIGTTPMQFLSIHPFINYVSVHLCLAAYLYCLPNWAPSTTLVDTTLPLIDGALRTQAVILSIEMAGRSTNTLVNSSLLVQLVLGTTGATGGGQLGGMLRVWEPKGWHFQTPPILTAKNPVAAIDVWAALFASFFYGLSTKSHESYAPILSQLNNGNDKPLLSAVGGRAVATLIFAIAFAYRAIKLHWVAQKDQRQEVVGRKVNTIRSNSNHTNGNGNGNPIVFKSWSNNN